MLSPPVDAYAETGYTIFEGTSEIQRLVIARAISGVRISQPSPADGPVLDRDFAHREVSGVAGREACID